MDTTAGVFNLTIDDLEQAAREAATGLPVWQACRSQAPHAVGSLATVRTPSATWADLVLPETQLDQLRTLVASIRHRALVLDDWGFAARGPRGLGSTALFAGPSGTGKTLAVDVVANDLGLDLVHMDLSQVVSKWIGETEKHLARLFDAEEFRGLAILTTNARNSLDAAFTRRLRTVVSFPYPDARLRKSLWEKAFPAATPVGGIDPRSLAAVDMAGGGIAAIALTAAYLAAQDSAEVGAEHVHKATRWERTRSGRASAALPRRPA